MIKINTKKIMAYVTILVIGLGFGLGLTYLRAEYADQSTTAPSNNPPPPILLGDLSGDSPFIKIGKLGISTGSTGADTGQFTGNSMVVGGSTNIVEGLSVSGDAGIKAELANTSSLKTFVFGDNTNSSLWQFTNFPTNTIPRTFTVDGYTRAARVVIGSTTVDPANYNLYVPVEGVNNDGGRLIFMGGMQYCTLTADELKDKGCPATYTYQFSKYTPTYMSQVIPGTGSQIVAKCNMMTEQGNGSSTARANANQGKCY